MEFGTKLVSGKPYWDSVKNWVHNTLECHEISSISKAMLDLRSFHFVDHGVNWNKCTVSNISMF